MRPVLSVLVVMAWLSMPTTMSSSTCPSAGFPVQADSVSKSPHPCCPQGSCECAIETQSPVFAAPPLIGLTPSWLPDFLIERNPAAPAIYRPALLFLPEPTHPPEGLYKRFSIYRI